MTKACSRLTTHNSLFQKAIAFTLAETLIVMGVIGVVAALTLPNLNSSTGDKEKVAKVKKIYSEMNDALGRAEAIYGPVDTWMGNTNCNSWGDGKKACAKKFGDRLTEFMKVSKNCGTSGSGTCFSNNAATPYVYEFVLADGISVTFHFYSAACSDTRATYNDVCGDVSFDIDGPRKGKFKNGTDVFSFVLTKSNGFTVYKGDFDYVSPCLQDPTNSTKDCTTWVINNDNMDYLKCPDKLSSTVTTCK